TRLLSLTAVIAGLAIMTSGVEAQAPPAPAAVIGHGVGENGRLADWATIRAYFDALDAASPRLTLEPIGQSVGGREMIMAVITSEENQKRIEEIRTAQGRLADPRTLSQMERERLVASQPAVAFIG